eukprot:scaffold8194_cov118-Cylindrotheca_fusiformis.AAC.13
MGFALPQRRWEEKKGMQCPFSIASSRSAGHVYVACIVPLRVQDHVVYRAVSKPLRQEAKD